MLFVGNRSLTYLLQSASFSRRKLMGGKNVYIYMRVYVCIYTYIFYAHNDIIIKSLARFIRCFIPYILLLRFCIYIYPILYLFIQLGNAISVSVLPPPVTFSFNKFTYKLPKSFGKVYEGFTARLTYYFLVFAGEQWLPRRKLRHPCCDNKRGGCRY